MGKGTRTRVVIAAGLGQLALLLLAFWAVRHDLLLSASLFGLSLLPIGLSFRLGWLRGAALAWGVVVLILSWQQGGGDGIGDAVGAPGRLAFLLAAIAAAAGQWLHLDQLQLGRAGAVVRGLTKGLIGVCVLLLLAFLQGGMGLEVALALFFGTLADLAFTAFTYLLAALDALRGRKRAEA